jgi:1,4-dihydroxy-2-naphthoyl-CoA hydrolase
VSIWHAGEFPLAHTEDLKAGTLVEKLGIEFVEAGPDWVKGRMPVDERTRQYAGILHGGASVAFAETLASAAGYYTLDPERFVCVGMEINANHVRPAADGWVWGLARPDNLGRTTQIWSIRITDSADKLVCISRCTLAVIPKPAG